MKTNYGHGRTIFDTDRSKNALVDRFRHRGKKTKKNLKKSKKPKVWGSSSSTTGLGLVEAREATSKNTFQHRAPVARVSGNNCPKSPEAARHPSSPRYPSDHVPLSRITFPKYRFFWRACGALPLYSVWTSSFSSNSKYPGHESQLVINRNETLLCQ